MDKRIWFLFVLVAPQLCGVPHYYVSASEGRYFRRVENLIASIHRFDYDDLAEIAVFDLGFSPAEIAELETMDRVKVYQTELVNPWQLTTFKSWRGRLLVGYMSWKPVVVKQACGLFPYFLFLDAGSAVTSNPENLFKHIIEKGYFFIDSYCQWLGGHTTQYVVKHVIEKDFPQLKEHLLAKTTFEISSGVQGLSRQMLDSYIRPAYEYAKNIRLFEDDGTAPRGPWFGRHDQTIFSILVQSLGLKIHTLGRDFDLEFAGTTRKYGIECDQKSVNEKTLILVQNPPDPENFKFIHYRPIIKKSINWAKVLNNYMGGDDEVMLKDRQNYSS